MYEDPTLSRKNNLSYCNKMKKKKKNKERWIEKERKKGRIHIDKVKSTLMTKKQLREFMKTFP
jgi:hypothetical protein